MFEPTNMIVKNENNLFFACQKGDIERVKLFLKNNGDINYVAIYAAFGGSSLLFTACQYYKKEIVELLLDHKVDVNHLISNGIYEGKTILHYTCYIREEKIIAIAEALIKYGADINQPVTYGNDKKKLHFILRVHTAIKK